ncbi:type II toxin-antitoxin system YafQ family toxin [Olsenella sp. YH-ols2217]|uniref:Type II toxin-antitoxin system YafQ family toxin n=1 Tax=Kribbibacterium absianum TaxID=3044210 RepID=A0ABT6ZHX9_9ACTN|nr:MULTISPECIES: type II toxin-antitoxin system YafQ family toxin [unclassified Olsenella]MDJ1121167.1 type II toxin-antitoxin system YafQ family toxin [Olsenella sp. YH-ols2216]MDJ1128658.1 type II toxin-antitoxin system YafQ family toxin [Olsenella sp. YH-ols2217]
MLRASFTPRFRRDVKACQKRHWDTDALKRAVTDLLASDSVPLPRAYGDHSLSGPLSGNRSIHVDSAPNPPADTWVLMYRRCGDEILLVRTGTHNEVYGRSQA